ncbi:MAG: hypothetical protein ACFFCS_12250 [Candidatus Hodarchaeota archaeon]
MKNKPCFLIACLLALSWTGITLARPARAMIEPGQSSESPWAIGEGWTITWDIKAYNMSNSTLLENRSIIFTATRVSSSGSGSVLDWEMEGNLQLNPGIVTDWEDIITEEIFYRYQPGILDYNILLNARSYRCYFLPVHLPDPLAWFQDGIEVIYDEANWSFTELTTDLGEELEYTFIVINKTNANHNITMFFNGNGVLKNITENDVNGTTYFQMVLVNEELPSNIEEIVFIVFSVAGAGTIVLVVVYYIIKRNKLSVRDVVDEEPSDATSNHQEEPTSPA